MPLDVKIPNTSEIDQALKEFEVQSSEQVPEQMTPVTKSYDPDVPKMVQLVIKLSRGSIKNQKQAEYVRHKVNFPWLNLTIPTLWYLVQCSNF